MCHLVTRFLYKRIHLHPNMYSVHCTFDYKWHICWGPTVQCRIKSSDSNACSLFHHCHCLNNCIGMSLCIVVSHFAWLCCKISLHIRGHTSSVLWGGRKCGPVWVTAARLQCRFAQVIGTRCPLYMVDTAQLYTNKQLLDQNISHFLSLLLFLVYRLFTPSK